MVTEVAATRGLTLDKYGIPGYEIADITDVGNLMGAIQGTDLSGFIGNVYRLFPFPQSVEEFKHKPYGAGRRATVEELIGHWARGTRVSVAIEAGSLNVRIADSLFSRGYFSNSWSRSSRGGCGGGRTM